MRREREDASATHFHEPARRGVHRPGAVTQAPGRPRRPLHEDGRRIARRARYGSHSVHPEEGGCVRIGDLTRAFRRRQCDVLVVLLGAWAR